MSIIESLNWRYAAKRMTAEKVPAEKINEIVEAIRLSASSTGLQPYKLVIVENEELKKKLQPHSFNPQVSESSHLLVFAAYESITKEQIENYINHVATVRGVAPESMADFKTKLEGALLPMPKDVAATWAAKQAYIALGTGILAAAALKVDTTPMEGFNTAEFDAILGLKEKGLKSVVLLALGYRDEANDFLSKLKKVRQPVEQFATTIA